MKSLTHGGGGGGGDGSADAAASSCRDSCYDDDDDDAEATATSSATYYVGLLSCYHLPPLELWTFTLDIANVAQLTNEVKRNL